MQRKILGAVFILLVVGVAPGALNADVNYRIIVTNGVVDVTVNGETQSQNFYATDPHWKKVDFSFKAGAYYTGNGGTTNATQVSFYAFAASHLTNAPAATAL